MKAHTIFPVLFLVFSSLPGIAQQDTAKARPDSSAGEKIATDSLEQKPPLPAAKLGAKYQIDTSFEAMNLEQLYYGMDGPDASYDSNPWDDYLFQDADGREEDERDQRDQERDSRE